MKLRKCKTILAMFANVAVCTFCLHAGAESASTARLNSHTGLLSEFDPGFSSSSSEEYYGGKQSSLAMDLTQSSQERTLRDLSAHVTSNYSYYDRYALEAANNIGSGNASWSEASLNIDNRSGSIVLSLVGRALLPDVAALFFGSPPMELRLVFEPDKCFQYAMTTHQLNVSGPLANEIRNEVDAALERSKLVIESSLNNEVSHTLQSLKKPTC